MSPRLAVQQHSETAQYCAAGILGLSHFSCWISPSLGHFLCGLARTRNFSHHRSPQTGSKPMDHNVVPDVFKPMDHNIAPDTHFVCAFAHEF